MGLELGEAADERGLRRVLGVGEGDEDVDLEGRAMRISRRRLANLVELGVEPLAVDGGANHPHDVDALEGGKKGETRG